MKWFKHISDSLDDPFIYSLIKKYRLVGYGVFFGMIEIVARECKDFDGFVELSCGFCARKLQLSCNNLKKIVTFIGQSGRFDVKIENDILSIKIPKLKELSDNWTHTKLRSNYEVTHKKRSNHIDKEVEVEEDERGKAAHPQSFEEVRDFWLTEELRGDPESFFNHFESNGWKMGRGGLPIKKWKMAARNWSKREFGFKKSSPEVREDNSKWLTH